MAETVGRVAATCISVKKGTRKQQVPYIDVERNSGIVGDAHAGAWHRQVSLLGSESVDRMRDKGLELVPGDFAENILTEGLVLKELPIGTLFSAGPDAVLCLTQIGKTCHNDCEIRRITGMCVMPTDGVFCVVVRGGRIAPGDEIRVIDPAAVEF
jgi:cyclic pyranopterin phosphate synthase